MNKKANPQRLANILVSKKTAHGNQTASNVGHDEKPIKSLRTEGHYKYSVGSYMRWRKFMGLSLRDSYLPSESTEFLEEMAEILEQKQLDSCRQAIQKVFKQELPRVKSLRETILSQRAYRPSEVLEIANTQGDRNALCTALCFSSGLRAHEILTLRPAEELARADHNQWSKELFAGIEDPRIYTVKGKGGLLRHVAVPRDLSILVEQRRLPCLTVSRDRKIDYKKSQYDIGAGQSFSQSFGEASRKVLGFSMGAHGLRHSYAQRRIRTLRALGFSINHALKILSEELGHFRVSVTWAYLR